MPYAPPQYRPPHRTLQQQGKSGSRLINSWRWRKKGGARQQYLNEHPLCVRCLAKGRTVVATEVDHVTPHRENYELFWDQRNWQALCKPCHSVKTTTEDGGFGNG